jgi:hypothetical protein
MRFPGWTHQKSCWHSPRPSYQRSVSFALEHSLYRSGPAHCNVLVPPFAKAAKLALPKSFCKNSKNQAYAIGRPLRKDLAVKRARADTKEPSRTGATRKNMATYRNGRLEAERTHSPQECSEVECVDCFEHGSDPDQEFCVFISELPPPNETHPFIQRKATTLRGRYKRDQRAESNLFEFLDFAPVCLHWLL